MTPAELVAQRLTAQFLRDGSFVSASRMSGELVGRLIPQPANATGDDLDLEDALEDVFQGLAVQGVGHEEGGDEQVVHIYVTRGSPRAIKTVEVDDAEVKIKVDRVGRLVVRPEQAQSSTARGNVYKNGDRFCCGSSCAPTGEQYAGTFGAIVRKGQGKNLYLLSNNHVIAGCNHTPVDTPILVPSNLDGGPGRAPVAIAKHSEICALRSGEPTLVDPCEEDTAIALITDQNRISSWQGDDENGYDTPTVVANLKSGMAVKKFGRTTGFTTGKVQSKFSQFLSLPYKTKHFSATVWFKNVWTVVGTGNQSFAAPGDSGSLVVNEDGTKAIGLIFAVSGTDHAFVVPMSHIVANCFGGIRLVGGHGV